VPAWLDEADRLAERTGAHHEWLHSRIYRACLAEHHGEPAGAQFDAVLADFRRIGDRRCTVRCLLGLGRAAMADRNGESARRHLTEAVTIATALGETPMVEAGRRLLDECD